ncbi:MAG TPA: hypothetical protein DCR14_09200 [Acidimicrobiaceae bacterium]|nr:hypothetical protein [Acidimicrobiaceae bacterium]
MQPGHHSLYVRTDVLAAERAAVFGRGWLCVGLVAEVSEPGSVMVREVGSLHDDALLSVVIVRDAHGSLRAFRNACPHRGAEVVEADCRTAARFVCPYHAWVFRLDGTCVGAPHMQGAVEADGSPFDAARHGLPELPLAEWQGFVYVCLGSPAPPPPTESLGELSGVLDRYAIAGYVPVAGGADVWNTNWKCLLENFLDAYHVFKVHAGTFAADSDSTGSTTVYPGGDGFTYHVGVDDPHSAYGVAHAANTRLEGTWRHSVVLAAVYPAHVMQVQPDWMWSLSLSPLGVGRVHLRWWLAVAPEMWADEPRRPELLQRTLSLLDAVNAEDRPVVEGVWRAMHHRDVPNGPSSRLEGNVRDIQRWLLAQLTPLIDLASEGAPDS